MGKVGDNLSLLTKIPKGRRGTFLFVALLELLDDDSSSGEDDMMVDTNL
jgi:hypothetical protein